MQTTKQKGPNHQKRGVHEDNNAHPLPEYYLSGRVIAWMFRWDSGDTMNPLCGWGWFCLLELVTIIRL